MAASKMTSPAMPSGTVQVKVRLPGVMSCVQQHASALALRLQLASTKYRLALRHSRCASGHDTR